MTILTHEEAALSRLAAEAVAQLASTSTVSQVNRSHKNATGSYRRVAVFSVRPARYSTPARPSKATVRAHCIDKLIGRGFIQPTAAPQMREHLFE